MRNDVFERFEEQAPDLEETLSSCSTSKFTDQLMSQLTYRVDVAGEEPVDQVARDFLVEVRSAGAVTLPHPAIKMCKTRPVSVFELARGAFILLPGKSGPLSISPRKNQACQEHCGAGCQQDSIFAV